MKKLLLSLCFVQLLYTLQAQQLKQFIEAPGKHVSRYFTNFSGANVNNFDIEKAAIAFNLNEQTNFILKEVQQDGDAQVYRLIETYNNIPVENSMYNVRVQKSKLLSAAGNIITEFQSSVNSKTTAPVNANKAIGLALHYVNADEYMWQIPAVENDLKNSTNNPNATYYPSITKVWYNSGSELNAEGLRLAYKVDIYSAKPFDRAYYFIDASTGELLGKKEILNTSDAVGNANTLYCGEREIRSDKIGNNNYRLRDYSRGGGIVTVAGGLTGYGKDYTSNSADWNLSLPARNALDAHWGVAQTYDFYKKFFNRDSYDNKGSQLKSYINYFIYTILSNASWDGNSMQYGEIFPSNKGVTAIDVTGHELTHGVTQSTSNLNYSGESGGMNESMSDIFGKAIQFFSRPDDKSWQIGNEMNWIIRDMSDPKAFQQPNTYGGQYWKANADVHTLSGVGNYFYYLLCVGGNGTNDIGNTYNVKGIGVAKATQIMYRTNVMYLTPTSKYEDWRTACIQAAQDLFGNTSNEVTQVKNAWYAVGVGAAPLAGNSLHLSLLNIQPNPVNSGVAVIKYQLAEAGNVTIKITNAYGVLLQNFSVGYSTKGTNNYTLRNLGNLKTGNYYVTLEKDGIINGGTTLIISK